MKRACSAVLTLVLFFAMFAGSLIPTAYASETYNVSIPVTMDVTGSKPVEGAYAEITLTPLTDNAPMPAIADANGRIYLDLTVEGKNTVQIDMTYPEMGIYQYRIQMTGGTYYHQEIHGTEYKLDVFNLSDTHDYSDESYKDKAPNFFQIYTTLGDEQGKQEELVYPCPLTDINVVKEWIDQASVRPSSVTVQLLLNKEEVKVPIRVNGVFGVYTYAEKKLNKDNDWQGSWHGVDNLKSTYYVKEKVVPAGYKDSYTYKDGVYWITNTGALLQTGQLNWPIPVLCGAGSLFMLAGMLILRRKEEDNA